MVDYSATLPDALHGRDSRRQELNLDPNDYKSSTLPLSYTGSGTLAFRGFLKKFRVARDPRANPDRDFEVGASRGQKRTHARRGDQG